MRPTKKLFSRLAALILTITAAIGSLATVRTFPLLGWDLVASTIAFGAIFIIACMDDRDVGRDEAPPR